MKKYIKSDTSVGTLPKVKSATASYTGGGFYVFLGEFVDGTYFIAEYPEWCVRVVNEDPRPTFWGDDSETDAGYTPWQEAHLIEDIDDNDTVAFFNDMFTWILQNKPDDNYNSGDIEEMMDHNNHRNESGHGVNW